MLKRTELIETLQKIQVGICAYRSKTFCDCKYGADKVGLNSEDGSGCPEMRQTLAIMNEMTDEEYQVVLNRIVDKRKVKGPIRFPSSSSKFDAIIVSDETIH